MRSHPTDLWSYDPRPVDRIEIRATYDTPSGRYRLHCALWRHGDSHPTRQTVEGLSRDEVADHVAVVLSSVAEDDVWPF